MTDFFNIERVNSVPLAGSRVASTMYVSKGPDADLAEITFIGTDVNEVRHVISKSNINTLITDAISSFSNLLVYPDIATRDAAVLTRNVLALVTDASVDPTVTSGSALYVYEYANTTWTKVSEFESLDVVLEWANIQNKPTSTVVDIDDAVTKRHTHVNKVTIDKLDEANGNLVFDGTEITNRVILVTADW